MELNGQFDYDRELDSGIRVGIEYSSFEPGSSYPCVNLTFDRSVLPHIEEALTSDALEEKEQELYGDDEVALHGIYSHYLSCRAPTPDREAAEAFTEELLRQFDAAAQ